MSRIKSRKIELHDLQVWITDIGSVRNHPIAWQYGAAERVRIRSARAAQIFHAILDELGLRLIEGQLIELGREKTLEHSDRYYPTDEDRDTIQQQVKRLLRAG